MEHRNWRRVEGREHYTSLHIIDRGYRFEFELWDRGSNDGLTPHTKKFAMNLKRTGPGDGGVRSYDRNRPDIRQVHAVPGSRYLSKLDGSWRRSWEGYGEGDRNLISV